jgi:hypothetical protein
MPPLSCSRELTPRLPKAGLLPNDAELIERIVGAK